jgi:hypothetical protein
MMTSLVNSRLRIPHDGPVHISSLDLWSPLASIQICIDCKLRDRSEEAFTTPCIQHVIRSISVSKFETVQVYFLLSFSFWSTNIYLIGLILAFCTSHFLLIFISNQNSFCQMILHSLNRMQIFELHTIFQFFYFRLLDTKLSIYTERFLYVFSFL